MSAYTHTKKYTFDPGLLSHKISFSLSGLILAVKKVVLGMEHYPKLK